MRSLLTCAFALSLVCPSLVSYAGSDSDYKDKFSTTVEFDSAFQTIFLGAWSRQLSDHFSAKTQMEILSNFHTMALLFRLYYKCSDFKTGLGIGTSFGLGSFGIPLEGVPDRKKYFLGRDFISYALLEYAPSGFLFHASSSFWLPTQESHDTALWVLYATFIAAVHVDGWLIGPWFEPFFVKEGQGSLEASELRIGGILEKSFDYVTFSLLLGYDPYERDSYLGLPKAPGFVGRGAFAVRF